MAPILPTLQVFQGPRRRFLFPSTTGASFLRVSIPTGRELFSSGAPPCLRRETKRYAEGPLRIFFPSESLVFHFLKLLQDRVIRLVDRSHSSLSFFHGVKDSSWNFNMDFGSEAIVVSLNFHDNILCVWDEALQAFPRRRNNVCHKTSFIKSS